MTEIINSKKEYERAVQQAAKMIAAGEIVAFPTETVYGLGGDAMDPLAIAKIFEVKGRPSDNPLIVHICEIVQAGLLAREIPPLARKLMEAFWPGPFTVVLKKKPDVPNIVTGGLDSVAIRMPHNSIARDIIRESGRLVAAPSANLSGKPSPTRAEHVWDDLQGRIPLIIDGGECLVGVESTVCDVQGDVPMILRPGGITAEMIKSVAGDVRVHPAVLGELHEEEAASPGMRYKHYAPSAEITVIVGKGPDIIEKISQMYFNCNTKCAIMCLHEHCSSYIGKNVIDLGAGNKEATHNLFNVLRTIDKEGYEKVFFHAVETDELGLALMNRMMRAAGHNVIAAKEV
ncbi:MAG: L-threonylcarbamoyladenylate synthase [Eubacteriales bacterium]